MKPSLALVSFTRIFGGGEVYYQRLCELLQSDFEIHALVTNAELASRLSAAKIHVELLPEVNVLQRWTHAARRLREMVQRHRVSTVHLNGQAEANLSGACKRLGVRTVITRHTELGLQSGILQRTLYRHYASRADAIICVSQHLANQHERFVAPEKLHVIPPWIEVTPRARPHGNDHFRILFAGRVERDKGFVELMAAAERLPDLQFLVAGDGDLRATFENRAGLGHVQFLGFRHDLADVFSQADLLVHPSHSEGSSLVVLEAMACGLPCLVSDIPVMREIAKNGSAATLFPPGDVDALVEAIENLLTDTEQRKRLAATALDNVRIENAPGRAFERYREVLTCTTGSP